MDAWVALCCEGQDLSGIVEKSICFVHPTYRFAACRKVAVLSFSHQRTAGDQEIPESGAF